MHIILLFLLLLFSMLPLSINAATDDAVTRKLTPEAIKIKGLIKQGKILAENGDFDKAIDAFDHAVKLNENSADAYYHLGMTYMLKDDIQNGLKFQQKSIGLILENAQVRMSMAVIYERSNRLDDAIQQYRTVIQQTPGSAESIESEKNINLLLIRQYTETNNLDAALALAAILRRNYSSDPRVLHTVGLAYFDFNRTEDAEGIFKQLAQLSPNSATPFFYLGRLHEISARIPLAVEQYKRAVMLEPGSDVARRATIRLGIINATDLLKKDDSQGALGASMATPVTAQQAMPTAKPQGVSAPNTVPSFKLDTVLRYELTWYQGSGALQDATTPTGEYANESGFRRVRITTGGKLHEDVSYKVSLEMADTVNQGDPVELNQAYITYSGLDPVNLKVGQFSEPFSMEAMKRAFSLRAMKRGLPYRFYPDRNLGIGISSEPTDNLTLEGGLFANNVDSSGKSKASYTGRITYAPRHNRDKVVHLGASASYRVPENSRDNVDSVLLTVLEATVVSGPFSVEGEYIQSDISRINTRGKRAFDGYYIHASWFATGESRRYRNGKFASIKPEHTFNINKGGWGAWELTGRSGQVNDENGRTLSEITLGLNWYLNRDIHFIMNYVQADYARGLTQGNANIFEVRGQVEF